jgi:signal transduction histidine kinase
MYYVTEGLLGVYLEEGDVFVPISIIEPGKIVGELGVTTGRTRTATVKAERESCVIYVSDDDYQMALMEAPGLAADIVRMVGEKLLAADVARVTIGRSYEQAMDRVQALHTEKSQLEELLRLREELADTIVHDLRNPLGVIFSGVQLLERLTKQDTGSEAAVSVLDTISRAVGRMKNLVDTLLDIARLEEGEAMLRVEPLDLGPLVEELVTEELPLAEQDGISLEALMPEGLPQVSADAEVVQRIVLNLLDNALKFTPAGGGVVVNAQPVQEMVRVNVIDTGPGIPVEERKRIFEKFTQIQGRVGSRRGAGLGLTFCKMAVGAHGGEIWVEDNQDGVGSCFSFTLPCGGTD